MSYSLIQYNLADKKSSFNAESRGAGISFRRYRDKDLRWFGENKLGKVSLIKEGTADAGIVYNTYPKGNQWNEKVSISDIPAGCRAQSTDLLAYGNKIVAWISISPTMYAFQEENAGEWFILAGPKFGFRF